MISTNRDFWPHATLLPDAGGRQVTGSLTLAPFHVASRGGHPSIHHPFILY